MLSHLILNMADLTDKNLYSHFADEETATQMTLQGNTGMGSEKLTDSKVLTLASPVGSEG